MAEDRDGESAAWLLAVKAAMDFVPQRLRLGGIGGIRQALREFGELVTGQLTLARQLESELQHARLFCARQVLNFFNDTGGGHKATLPNSPSVFK